MILKYVSKSKKDNKTWFDVKHLYPIVLKKKRLNGEFSHSYIIPGTNVTYKCTVVWYNEKVLLYRTSWCQQSDVMDVQHFMPWSTNQCLYGDFVSSGCKQIDQTTGHIA